MLYNKHTREGMIPATISSTTMALMEELYLPFCLDSLSLDTSLGGCYTISTRRASSLSHTKNFGALWEAGALAVARGATRQHPAAKLVCQPVQALTDHTRTARRRTM